MSGSIPQTEVCEALLRSLAQADTAAWCFVPVGASVVTWQSQAFRELFASPQPKHHLPIQGADPALTAATLISLLDNGQITETIEVQGRSWSVQVSVVLDDDGQPFGRLVHLHNQEEVKGSQALLRASQDARDKLATLSPREVEVLNLIYEGLTNKAIAARSHISQKTVEKHRGRISKKLQTTNVAELVRLVATARMADYAAFPSADVSTPAPQEEPVLPR